MSFTNITEVQDQIQKFWAPIFMPELKESALLPALVNTEYSDEIKQQGDTVRVSMVVTPAGSRQQISEDGSHTTIITEKLQTKKVDLKADQIFSASLELDSLIDLQSQLGSEDGQSKIRQALLKAVELKINDFIYGLVSPSTSNPDHVLSGVANFDFAALQNIRKLAAQAKWVRDDNWHLLLDPSYMTDFLSDTKNTSGDFVNDAPLIAGVKPYKRSGFNIFEDNSDAMKQLSPTGNFEDLCVAFHKDFLYMALQGTPVFKLSDLHSNKQRGYLLTVDIIGGAITGLQGDVKQIKTFNT